MRDVLQTPIEDLDLGVRAFNFIKKYNYDINTVGDLISYTREDIELKSGNSFESRKCIDEINVALKTLNLKLKTGKTGCITKHIHYTRVLKCLLKNDIKTVEDIFKNEEKILTTPGLGPGSISYLDTIFYTDFLTKKEERKKEMLKEQMIEKLKPINMKIELISEKEFGKTEWYEIRVDGHYITGSSNLETAENLYNEFLRNPSKLKKEKIVLKSDEINVSSQSNQTV